MDKYQNKYRIASARAAWWNYGWAGAYFITICTEHRAYRLGELQQDRMRLSNAGVLADVCWHQIPHHAKPIELGAFVVMPNHVHGILILHDDAGGISADAADPADVETLHATSLPPQNPQNLTGQKNEFMAAISPKSNTVSSIIRSYKSAVTKHANRLGIEFGWQPRFHDHIIRTDASYQRINDYIENNPKNWMDDRFYGQEET